MWYYVSCLLREAETIITNQEDMPMPRSPKRFHVIRFDWPIPAADRRLIEEFLSKSLGYDVDGGGTDPEAAAAQIHIRPKARSHKRRVPPLDPKLG